MNTLFALFLILLINICFGAIYEKHLSGPPSDFKLMGYIDPASFELRDESAVIPIEFNGNPTFTATLPVESISSPLTFSILFPKYDEYILSLEKPNGQQIKNIKDLEQYEAFPMSDDGSQTIPSYTFILEGEEMVGEWKLSFTPKSQTTGNLTKPFEEEGLIFLEENHNLELVSYLSTFTLFSGQTVGVRAKIEDVSTSANVEVLPEVHFIEVIDPSGDEVIYPMYDDGKHFDLEANDGFFGASFLADEIGSYRVETVFSGEKVINGESISFRRTNSRYLPIVPHLVDLTDTVWIDTVDEDVLSVNYLVKLLSGEIPDRKYRAYSEVYGTNENGELVPVCWIGGVIALIEDSKTGDDYFTLELNKNWLKIAGVSEPFEFKNTVLVDLGSNFPVSINTEIKFDDVQYRLGEVIDFTQMKDENLEITIEMREGKKPQAWIEELNVLQAKKAAAPNLLLAHGYCSKDNPFEGHPEFTNGAYYLDSAVSVVHDSYARSLIEFTNSQGMSSCGAIGHSQGGPVLLHMYQYYHSCLDNAKNGYLIQSIGSPYQGTTIAGWLADLGYIFGVQCGSNTDLTISGAANWLKGIDSFHRESVNYYLTTYTSLWCHVAVQTVLKSPNDGCTEEVYGMLEGANYRGRKLGWCHTNGMRYPEQTDDSERNKEWNDKAAR